MDKETTPIAYTAFRVMFHVALEQYEPEEHRLIHDDLARQMLPGGLKVLTSIFGFKPLRRGFLRLIEQSSPGMRGGFCRKRYIDDKLVEALDSGIDAVVILGAGLDTRAYRMPQLATLSIYEVDLPQTIDYKRRKLQELYGSVPAHVRLIPIDFDRERLESVLSSHGYSPDQKSFFIWEGVTQYISEAAVHTVFEFLAKARPGSCIVFTYILKDFIDGERIYGQERLYQLTRVKQQLWQFGLHPSQISTFLGKYSWKDCEQVGANEYRQRYLHPLGRTEAVMEIERAVYAVKQDTR
ncbi:MAG TPA: SAM-dependent methyltransferase [Anaerolineales bacterium]|nr:SAM-dependent methyltransferase [Anaerolineales bacterium]